MLSTERASLALSRTPKRLTMVKRMSTMAASAHAGNGNATSPARYAAAVADETMEVAAKSSISSDDPTTARDLVDTLSLFPISAHPQVEVGTAHKYVYGAPLMGSADANSIIIGLHRKRIKVAMKRHIGEYTPATTMTAGNA